MTRTRFVHLTLLTERPLVPGTNVTAGPAVLDSDPYVEADDMYAALTILAAQYGYALTEPLVEVGDGTRCGYRWRVKVTAGVIP